MTEKKQITIEQLFPLLRPGWVAMDESKRWWWYGSMPAQRYEVWIVKIGDQCSLLSAFNIAPFDGDWKDSLMECGK